MKITHIILVSMLSLSVAACGSSKTDRALSGGAIGAGAGAVGSSLLGGNAATGALLGGAAGAIVGGTTSQRNINLGKPIWR
jgi:osmotically inducible lipoprotein OsmB